MESWPNIILPNLFLSIGYSRVAWNIVVPKLQNAKVKIAITTGQSQPKVAEIISLIFGWNQLEVLAQTEVAASG